MIKKRPNFFFQVCVKLPNETSAHIFCLYFREFNLSLIYTANKECGTMLNSDPAELGICWPPEIHVSSRKWDNNIPI